jgi:hypothetical protein
VTDVVLEFRRRLGIPVAKSLTLDDGFIVLLDYYEASKTGATGNLLRLRADGSLVWAVSRDARDLVTDVQWREGKLVAWTWGCYMITLDRSTGTVLESAFTK